MSAIEFFVMTGLKHRDDVAKMMRLLYEEDRGDFDVDVSRFESSIAHLVSNSNAGQIVLFRRANQIQGYALLIPYWSNEFGGTLLCIDELFVEPNARSQGIARTFFRYLEKEKPFNPVALALGVNPGNAKARRLYESLGFAELGIRTLIQMLPPSLDELD